MTIAKHIAKPKIVLINSPLLVLLFIIIIIIIYFKLTKKSIQFSVSIK